MTRTLFLMVALLALPFAALVAGQESPSVSSAGAIDIFFFSAQRPLLLRVRLELATAGTHTAWDQLVEAQFQFADQNGDGRLDAEERRRLPTVGALKALKLIDPPTVRQTTATLFQKRPPPITTPDDVRRYFQKLRFRLVRGRLSQAASLDTQSPKDSASAGPVSSGQVLFAVVDADGDGMLDSAEIDNAASRLARYDFDQDETIHSQELSPTINAYGIVQDREGRLFSETDELPVTVRIFWRTPRMSDRQIATRLLKVYAGPSAEINSAEVNPAEANEEALTPAQIGLPAEVFARFDRDSDGRLNLQELEQFASQWQPDLQVLLREGIISPITDSAKEPPTTAPESAPEDSTDASEGSREEDPKKKSPTEKEEKKTTLDTDSARPAAKATQSTGGKAGVTTFVATESAVELQAAPGVGTPGPKASRTATLNVGNVLLVFEMGPSREVQDAAALNSQIVKSFKQADRDKNEYLSQQELYELAKLVPLYGELDQDHDGKIFEKEFVEVLHPLLLLTEARRDLSINTSGGDLLELLDDSHDRRLSTRELRKFASRVKTWEQNQDGRLSAAELPRTLRFALQRVDILQEQRIGVEVNFTSVSQPNETGFQAFLKAFAGLRPIPYWFRKMDRNDDGDVSRREFLGTAETFRAMDRDGDGLLDDREAANASEPGK